MYVPTSSQVIATSNHDESLVSSSMQVKRATGIDYS